MFERIAWNKGLKGIQKSPFKNKSYEEIYGIDKANILKLKLSKSHLGQISWMTQKENRIKAIENGKRLGLSNRSRIITKDIREKISKSTKGKKRSFETRFKMSNSKKGIISPFKGRTYEEIYGKEKATKLLKIKRCYIMSEDTKIKLSKSKKGKESHFKNRTYEEIYGKERAPLEIKKRLHKILSKVCQRPNNFEKSCGLYLEYLFPNRFKYCGDGSVIINGKSPDYIAEEIKIIVLCNGLYWHLLKFGLKETSKNYQMIELRESKPFLDAGYEVWFIWENKQSKILEVKKWKTKFRSVAVVKNQ